MGYRKEVDLLGELNINNDAYYGIHTQRAIDNFMISTQKLSDIPALVKGLVLVKKASAFANEELNTISAEIADAIGRACDILLIEGDKYSDQFPIDTIQGGAGTSSNMNINEVIANLALEITGNKRGEYQIINPNDHVNASQSTNDAYPSGVKVGLYNESEGLIETALYLEHGLMRKAEEFADVLKMGRTQLQDAVPMSLGQEFKAFASLIKKSVEEIKIARKVLLTVNLGGTAIGTGVNAPEGYSEVVVRKLSEITGHRYEVAGDLIAATSDTSDFVTFHTSLKTLAIRLSKICNDLRLLSSGPRTGLFEINLPELQAGSSIMPAKVNPVMPEAVNNACFRIFGNDVTLMTASDAGQLQLNAMEPVMALTLFESLSLLTNSCRNLQDKCINGISANEAYCLNYIMNSIGILSYLNPVIGHAEGDIVGRMCIKTGKSVRDVILERGLMDAKEFDALFTLEALRKKIGMS